MQSVAILTFGIMSVNSNPLSTTKIIPMAIDQSNLTKGQIRKLNVLQKSIGDKLGEKAFSKWMKAQATAKPVDASDPVAEKLLAALNALEADNSIKLGNWGYAVRRAWGHSAKGFAVTKIVKSQDAAYTSEH
jgi:precorrin-6x reductase